MELKNIENLAKLLDEYSLTKIDVTDGKEHYVLERAAGVSPVSAAPAASPAPAASSGEAEKAQSAPTEDDSKIQKASLVGTVYLAPAEGKAPFVSVGDRVKKGDTVCIIEAMKILNEIGAERDGVIEQILVSNEETVEFGQGLFVIG